MFSGWLMAILFHPVLVYTSAAILAMAAIGWAFYEWQEYQTQNECRRRRLPYVRIPSQILALLTRKRYDLIEMDLIKRFGKFYGSRLWNQFTIVIADNELAQICCNREFTKMPNRRPFQSYDPLFDSFLFANKDDDWKRLRAIVSPTFSSGKLRKVKYVIDETVQTMFTNLDRSLRQNGDGTFKVKEIIGAFTMDTIIQMAFGVKIDSLREPNNPVIRHVKNIFSTDIAPREILFFVLSITWPKMIKYLNLRFQPEAMDFFAKTSKQIITAKREELRTKKDFKASNFIELVLEVEREQQLLAEQNGGNNDHDVPFKHINDLEILAQCITFFMVGYDTTATTITNACHLLAAHPEKQEKLYKDIQKTLAELSAETPDGTTDPFQLITFDTINRFQYLNAALNESMRIYTIASAVEREATADLKLETSDGKIRFDVKKNDIIRIPIVWLHHDPENFSRPSEFIPERFLPADQQQGIDRLERFEKSAFMPFGSGPRNCLARSLAMLEAKMSLVHIFRAYRLDIDPVTKSPLNFYIQADFISVKDVKLRAEKR